VNRDQNAGQNQDVQTANRTFEHVTVQIFGNVSKKTKIDPGGN
jgi:hypothetical protein